MSDRAVVLALGLVAVSGLSTGCAPAGKPEVVA